MWGELGRREIRMFISLAPLRDIMRLAKLFKHGSFFTLKQPSLCEFLYLVSGRDLYLFAFSNLQFWVICISLCSPKTSFLK